MPNLSPVEQAVENLWTELQDEINSYFPLPPDLDPEHPRAAIITSVGWGVHLIRNVELLESPKIVIISHSLYDFRAKELSEDVLKSYLYGRVSYPIAKSLLERGKLPFGVLLGVKHVFVQDFFGALGKRHPANFVWLNTEPYSD